MEIYIPDNEYGVEERYYVLNEFVELLRKHKYNPDIVQFLADMLEE